MITMPTRKVRELSQNPLRFSVTANPPSLAEIEARKDQLAAVSFPAMRARSSVSAVMAYISGLGALTFGIVTGLIYQLHKAGGIPEKGVNVPNLGMLESISSWGAAFSVIMLVQLLLVAVFFGRVSLANLKLQQKLEAELDSLVSLAAQDAQAITRMAQVRGETQRYLVQVSHGGRELTCADYRAIWTWLMQQGELAKKSAMPQLSPAMLAAA